MFPRRKWYRFSLGTIALFVSGVAVISAYIGWRIDRGRRRLVAINELVAAGVEVFGPGCPEPIVPRLRPMDGWSRAQERRRRDVLWLFGWGPRLFGDGPFVQVASVEDFGHDADRASVDASWRRLATLTELDELVLVSTEAAWFRSPEAGPTLKRLSELRTLQMSGPVDDDVFSAWTPPKSLTTIALKRVSPKSDMALASFVSSSHVEALQIDGGSALDRKLDALRKLPSLGTLDLVRCDLNVAAVEILSELRPERLTIARSKAMDDETANCLRQIDLDAENGLYTKEEWASRAARFDRIRDR